MANGIDAMLGLGAGDAAKLQAMADALRRQQRGGAILALSPDKQISALGGDIGSQAAKSAETYGRLNRQALQAEALRRQQDRQFDATQAYRQQQQENWQRNFAAQQAERQRLAGQMSKPVQTWSVETAAPGPIVAQSGAGRMVDVNTGEPIDMTGLTLKDPAKGRSRYGRGAAPDTFTRPNAKQQEALEKRGVDTRNAIALVDSFKPEYASGTLPTGEIENWISRNTPALATEDMKNQQLWWARYKQGRELAERHELFGSALTATEQAEWKKATIGPNMQADQIARQLELYEKAMRYYARKEAENARSKGWNSDWIDLNLGEYAHDLDAVPPGVAPAEWSTLSDDDKMFYLENMQP